MTFPNISTIFQKKRDQKELLISVWYKRILYQYIKITIMEYLLPYKDNRFYGI